MAFTTLEGVGFYACAKHNSLCALLQSALGNKQRVIPGSTEPRAWAVQPPQKHEIPGSGDTTPPGSFPRAICWVTWQAHPTQWEAHHDV